MDSILIKDVICGSKGILNLSQIPHSPEVLAALNGNQDQVKHLTDMIIRIATNNDQFSTVILNLDQYGHQITDNSVSDVGKEYSALISDFTRGVHFREGVDSAEKIIEEKWNHDYDVIYYPVQIELRNDNKDTTTPSQFTISKAAIESITAIQKELPDMMVFIIDFQVKLAEGETFTIESLKKKLEQELYQFCTTSLLENECPLQNCMISINLPNMSLSTNSWQYSPAEGSAFQSLMVLQHGLPAGIGGIIFTESGQFNLNSLPKFLYEASKLKIINHWPTTFMTHPDNFVALAKHWNGQELNYINTSTNFSTWKAQLANGLAGIYQQFDKKNIITGNIQVGTIQ